MVFFFFNLNLSKIVVSALLKKNILNILSTIQLLIS